MRDAKVEGRLPILVGGTGLYFKALTEGLAAVPDVPPEIRAHWRARAERIGTDGLHRELAGARSRHGGKTSPERSATHRCARWK